MTFPKLARHVAAGPGSQVYLGTVLSSMRCQGTNECGDAPSLSTFSQWSRSRSNRLHASNECDESPCTDSDHPKPRKEYPLRRGIARRTTRYRRMLKAKEWNTQVVSKTVSSRSNVVKRKRKALSLLSIPPRLTRHLGRREIGILAHDHVRRPALGHGLHVGMV
jgi:hypothetical protein